MKRDSETATTTSSKTVTFDDSVVFGNKAFGDKAFDAKAFNADSVAGSVAVADSARRGFTLTTDDIDIIVGGTQSVLMLCVMYYLYIQSDEIVPRKQKKAPTKDSDAGPAKK